MAKAGQEFGKAILFVQGDDTQLRATLQRSEQITQRSAAKMQANLKPLVVGQQQIGQSASAASAAVGVLGATASATGNQALASAAQIGGMGAAMGGLANAAVAGAAGIKAMTVASLAFIATPIGAVVTAVGLAVGALGAAWFINNREQEEANKRQTELEEKLKASNKAIDDQVKALKERARIVRGGDPFANKPQRVRDAAADLASAEAQKKAREQEQARVTATAQRVEALGRELLILQGQRVASDFIVDDEERRLTVLRDRVTAEQRLLEQEKAKQQAAKAAFAGRVGPQTAGGARDLVSAELKVLEAQKARNELLKRELALRLAVGKITQKQFDTLQKQFGLERVQAGSTALSTFKQVSLSQTALGGPGVQKTQPVEDKKVASGLKRVERAVKNNRTARAA